MPPLQLLLALPWLQGVNASCLVGVFIGPMAIAMAFGRLSYGCLGYTLIA
jgi:hypothetical protein